MIIRVATVRLDQNLSMIQSNAPQAMGKSGRGDYGRRGKLWLGGYGCQSPEIQENRRA